MKEKSASPNGFQPERIGAVLFDLDGTLRHSRPSFYQTFIDIASRLDAPVTPQACWHTQRWMHYYWAQSPELLEDLQTYKDQQEQFWVNHYQLALLEVGCRPEQAQDLAPTVFLHMAEEFKPSDWVPPDVPYTLEILKDVGVRLAVVTNRTHPCQELIESLGLGGYFEFSLAAGEIQVWKPDPEIFHHALRRLGEQPGETLYVGDNYYADVVGARSAGLWPVLLDPDRIFPEAGCPVIQSVGDLPGLLQKQDG